MVLPKLSQTMAYTNPEQSTDVHKNYIDFYHVVPERPKRGINVRVFLEKYIPFPR